MRRVRPIGLPVLSRGRHRTPRRGGCLMEYASVLAGERWSDSPACTHPELAVLARAVNDCTSDAGRPGLLPLVPTLVHALGMPGEQEQLAHRLARRAALHALQVATGVRRRTLLVALLVSEQTCAPRPAGLPDRDRHAVAELLSTDDPDVAAAAALLHRTAAYVDEGRHGAATVLRLSVVTIAECGGTAADDLLRDLLVQAVAQVRGTTRVELSRSAAPS